MVNYRGPIAEMGLKKFNKISNMKWELRPDPSTYLSAGYIQKHLKKFEGEVVRFYKKSSLDNYGPGNGGVTFVFPAKEFDKIIAKAGGDRSKLEKILGYDKGDLGDGLLVKATFFNGRKHKARMPDGKEKGSQRNKNWIPGGKLPEGHNEAVINVTELADTDWTTAALNI